MTEGVLIGDFTRAVAILRRLKALGVKISMDDFGTGYSSLSYLQSFPFDKIKIDQAFISNLSRSAQSIAIVRAVIGLGRGLQLPVVAEGVETEEQLAFLLREECDGIQGFIIGRPLPIDAYAEIVGRGSAAAPVIRRAGRVIPNYSLIGFLSVSMLSASEGRLVPRGAAPCGEAHGWTKASCNEREHRLACGPSKATTAVPQVTRRSGSNRRSCHHLSLPIS